MVKGVMLFTKEQAPEEEPDALPTGPLAGGNPILAPDEGTIDDFGFVVGIPPDSDGDGAGENTESGSAVGGAVSGGNCCGPGHRGCRVVDNVDAMLPFTKPL